MLKNPNLSKDIQEYEKEMDNILKKFDYYKR
jgi:hypothetical protein